MVTLFAIDPDLAHNVRGMGWWGIVGAVLFCLAFTRWGR